MPNTNEMLHPHYKLPDGELVSKSSVDAALALINKVMAAECQLVNMTDSELFSSGDKIAAIRRFREKYDTHLLDAKYAIEHLRGEGDA